MAVLRVMTMNLASGSGEPYVDFSVATHASYLNTVQPDIVFLQEVDRRTSRAGGVDQYEILRTSTHLNHGHFVKWEDFQSGEYGIALLSRLPLTNPGNKTVWKPTFWWPYLLDKVLCQIASALVEVEGRTVFLYGTHFPNDSSGAGQQLSGEEAAPLIPTGAPVIFGGDFNASLGEPPLAGIEQKLRPASITAPDVIEETPATIDHIFVGGPITALNFRSVQAIYQGRRFSDHPIVWSDVEVPLPPPPPRQLLVSVQPYPVPVNRMVTVTVHAVDALTGANVAGEVKLGGTVIANTNTPFTHTFKGTRKHVGTHPPEWEVVYPAGTVSAPGYREIGIDFGFPDL